MRIIALDGRSWRAIGDVYDALLPALGAPHWHGRNMDALIDSMGTGAINDVEPPYRLRIEGLSAMPAEVREFLVDMETFVSERARGGGRDIVFELLP